MLIYRGGAVIRANTADISDDQCNHSSKQRLNGWDYHVIGTIRQAGKQMRHAWLGITNNFHVKRPGVCIAVLAILKPVL